MLWNTRTRKYIYHYGWLTAQYAYLSWFTRPETLKNILDKKIYILLLTEQLKDDVLSETWVFYLN